MTALLRAASPGLQAIMGPSAPAGNVQRADLFDFTLADGVTAEHWTSWDSDLTIGGTAYSSKNPWLTRSNWSVVNTLEVATLTLYLRALNGAFAGGAQIKQQIVQGLFDGAAFLFSRLYMPSPGGASLGALPLFGGEVGAVDIVGTTATLTIKAKVNKLDQNVPRNLVQVGCNHAFCDPGCTLNRATFTSTHSVGASPTATFIPWSGAAPGNAALLQNGTFALTSGAGAGQKRTIAKGDNTGLTLAYPLYIVPAPGDSFTGFQGCSKALSDGSGQDCTAYANTQNFRGFPYVPPPNSAY